MRTALAIGLIALMTTTSGCGQSRAVGSDSTAQRSYQVASFQRIEVAGPYQVDVRTGGAPSVSASGPKSAIDRLVVEVKGDKLFIHPDNHGFFSGGEWRGPVTVHVTAPAIVGASLAGSGDLRVDKVGGQSFEGNVGGSGNLAVDSLKVQSLNLSIGGSGNVGVGAGEAQDANYAVTGSGGIDARAVRSGTANVAITGSGGVQGQATASANINIMGSGDVTLTGGAHCTVSKVGSGNARCS
jgi:hypothetical protein